MKKAVCFGEVLWDIFPEGKSAGGAPMNVAFRLKDLGFQVEMMSRIGQDSHGEELGEIIDQKLGIGYIQTDKKYPTGIVKIGLDQNKNAQYDIVYPSSWDFIEYEDSWKRLVEESDVFVFGSLACRGRKTRSNPLQAIEFKQIFSFRYQFACTPL
ncbi:MAG: hypothetical protein FDW93_02170 [Bergeyella sp.]|nr:hypothetical protein [Bergeyella sp.]